MIPVLKRTRCTFPDFGRSVKQASFPSTRVVFPYFSAALRSFTTSSSPTRLCPASKFLLSPLSPYSSCLVPGATLPSTRLSHHIECEVSARVFLKPSTFRAYHNALTSESVRNSRSCHSPLSSQHYGVQYGVQQVAKAPHISSHVLSQKRCSFVLFSSPFVSGLPSSSLHGLLMSQRSIMTTTRRKSTVSFLRSAQHASGRLVRATPQLLMDVTTQCTSILVKSGKAVAAFIARPSLLLEWCNDTKDHIIRGIHWARRGFKIFGANLKVSVLLLKKKMKGQPLSFREHKLLVRTTSDLFKLIPFSFFIVVPFAELLLPIALWLFPGMLPSTFSERQVDNPYLQRKLKAKQELAQFFQELIAERTHQVLEESTSDRCKDRARLLKEFQEKLISKAQREAADSASYGESSGHPPSKVAVVGGALESPEDINPFLSVKETLKYAKLFREEFKLEKMPTRALLVLCEMLGLRPYRIRANIILQLRYHILRLQEEDREIMWEGVENLTHEELRDACRERAMRFYDVSDDVMRDQMTQWLTLSSHRDIPPLLLLWSRSITMTHGAPAPQRSLADGTPAQSRNIVNADELLPVIDASVSDSAPEEAKAKEDQIHEEFARIDRHLEALQETAKRLEEEHAVLTTATGTTAEDGTDDISIESYEATADDEDVRLVGSQTRAERTRLQKEALLKRSEKLEKEMQLLRTVTDLQHEQVTLLIRSLANLIDLYRSGSRQAGQLRHHRTLEAFVNRLEKTVSSFEEGVARVSNILEAAKCIRMSDEDAELYPSDAAKPSGSVPETSSPSSGLGQEKLPTGEEQPHNATKHFL